MRAVTYEGHFGRHTEPSGTAKVLGRGGDKSTGLRARAVKFSTWALAVSPKGALIDFFSLAFAAIHCLATRTKLMKSGVTKGSAMGRCNSGGRCRGKEAELVAASLTGSFVAPNAAKAAIRVDLDVGYILKAVKGLRDRHGSRPARSGGS